MYIIPVGYSSDESNSSDSDVSNPVSDSDNLVALEEDEDYYYLFLNFKLLIIAPSFKIPKNHLKPLKIN